MLLRLASLRLNYFEVPLLDNIDFILNEKEKVCLLGRNGEGKSTLLNIIEGRISPDSGKIEKRQDLKIAKLEQDVPLSTKGSIFEIVLQPFAEMGALLTHYYELSQRLDSEQDLALLEKLQNKIEAEQGWALKYRVDTILSRLSLNPDTEFSSLSGGWKRRVLLAKALVLEPDILLLDEPTNHLDIEAVEWLETFLQQYQGAVLFISHDRRFMQKVATRIIELDCGRLLSFPGNFNQYLEQKEAFLAAEEKANALFDKKLAEEETWIRQGIKARRTRNEGRVRALKAMRTERLQRREQQGKVNLQLDSGEKSGRIVIEANKVNFSFHDKMAIKDFSCTITRGDKVAIIGPNGCGKTTLLNILLGKLAPTSGSVRHGTQLNIAYFDQLRLQLDLEKSVLDNVAQGATHIEIGDTKTHAVGYLQKFLFAPDRIRQPVKMLSGGERNRLLLAKLFTQPANVLVLDEPTNDLDVESLEMLEALLVDYKGTLLLVCHDREFVNNVATTTLVFENNGEIQEYVGGYDDYLSQKPSSTKTPSIKIKSETKLENKPQLKKLNYQEQRELNNLPREIEKLEEEVAEIQQLMADISFYQKASHEINEINTKLKQLEELIKVKYNRWEFLDNK